MQWSQFAVNVVLVCGWISRGKGSKALPAQRGLVLLTIVVSYSLPTGPSHHSGPLYHSRLVG